MSKFLRSFIFVLAVMSILLAACGTPATPTEESTSTEAPMATEAPTAIAPGPISITGAGATFPFPLYSQWFYDYAFVDPTVKFNYQSIGSGGGIKQITAKTVDFGASDAPLKPEILDKNGLIQFPAIMGGVVPVYNIKGIAAGQIRLTGGVLAQIYLGKVARWNDATIAKVNPGVNLPNQAISVLHRSDGSGTTFLFTDYLSKVSAEWKSKVGANTAVEWPGGIGAKGNEGVANNVAQTKGSIGYVEYAYAKQNKLAFAKMTNKDGKVVAPTAASFTAAAASANWEGTPGFGVILTNEPGAGSWPIAGATFILMHKRPQDPAASAEALKFFNWAFAKGGKMAEDLDYVPMPGKVDGAIQKVWATEIKD